MSLDLFDAINQKKLQIAKLPLKLSRTWKEMHDAINTYMQKTAWPYVNQGMVGGWKERSGPGHVTSSFIKGTTVHVIQKNYQNVLQNMTTECPTSLIL